mgnify:CR=1 FL=1
MALNTTMKSSATVYYGPSTSKYPKVGSVSAGESVTAYWLEGSWCYIQYVVDSTGLYKRGYVSKSAMTSTSGLGTLESNQQQGPGDRLVQEDCKVYFGPGTTSYTQAGSLSEGEVIEFLGVKLNGYAFVEYKIDNSSQYKRAWVYANNLGAVTTPSGYTTYKKGDVIPSGLPMAGATVTQGWNDKTTNHKGHLGYDLAGNLTYAKPLFAGTVEVIQTSIADGNGRTVCVKHTVNGTTFYTSYCHLASILVSKGDLVTVNTNLGKIGGSGHGSETHYGTHLHVCAYTCAAGGQASPSGYCDGSSYKTFEQVTSYANAYYYGPDTSKFPRCGGACFYDPYGVVTSNAAIMKQYP